jgi:hypothetical protein
VSIDGNADNSLRLIKSSTNLVLELYLGGESVATVTVGSWRTGRQCIAFLAGKGFMAARYVLGPRPATAAPTSWQNFNAVSFGGDTVSTTRALVTVEKCVLRLFDEADRSAFSRIYSDAAASYGVPTFYDSFDRADGVIGVAPSGHTYTTVANGGDKVTPYVDSGLLVCDHSGGTNTAAYSVIDLEAQPTKIRALVSYAESGTSGSIALVSSATFDASGVDYIVVDGSIHPVWTATQVNVGIYVGSVLTSIAIITYPAPMVMDGTIYEIGYDLDLDTSTMYVVIPNSPPIPLQDSRFTQYAGRYQTYEHFASSQSLILPRFHHVEAT